MLNFIKKNIIITLIFLFTLSIGFLTFLTFLDKSFIELNNTSLQILLICNILLLFIFFILIFIEIKNTIKNDMDVKGSVSNKRYIAFFSLFTLIPSVLIAIFSLFLFSFALERYFDAKITTAVNNSYELAKKYVAEVRNKIDSDIALIGFDLNRYVNFYYDNPKKFKEVMQTQRIARNIDEIHLIDSEGNQLISSPDIKIFIPPENKALALVKNDTRPLKIINAFENKSSAILKLNEFNNTYLYIVKFLDSEISNFLTESEEAINFYYTVEDKRSGIQISFILIYVLIVTLLLFLSITIAIRFSSRFFRSINNLILASTDIGHGNLDTKVPEIKTDKELEILNKNFNLMIDRLKTQQDKLLLSERYEAWENVARKLAHEIKNPLTPIQLTIGRLKSKYKNFDSNIDKEEFDNYLQTINKQIKQIESLVNEFSDFARMPKPIFQKNDLIKLLESNIILLQQLDTQITINFTKKIDHLNFNCDGEQLNRVFFNIIKNSIESIQEKAIKNANFEKIITIVIKSNSDYITVIINDNGVGFTEKTIKNISKPYYTTKSNGTGLGLSIVSKIINDHNGTIYFNNNLNGAAVEINLPFIK